MGWDVLQQPTVAIIVKHFSSDELKEINAFYKTEAGRVYADKSPVIAIEVSNLIAEKMMLWASKRVQ